MSEGEGEGVSEGEGEGVSVALCSIGAAATEKGGTDGKRGEWGE